MRICLLLFGLCIQVCTTAQNRVDSSKLKPVITAFGASVGNKTTQKIDTRGGRLRSADGKLEVTFPADAVDSEITVSVQPIHNQLTADDDGAYQLEPSGIIFKRPVQLVFHYTDGNEN